MFIALVTGAFKSAVLLDIGDQVFLKILAIDLASGVGGSTPKMKKYSN